MKKKYLLIISITCFAFTLTTWAQTLPNYVPTNGLIGWWGFNGNANDISGHGYNGVVTGATLTADRMGIANMAYAFDSNINSSIELPIAGPILNTFTISLWVNPSRIIQMPAESNVCPGGVDVPMANSNQNWGIHPPQGTPIQLGVGLSVGNNGIIVAEHAPNVLVGRLRYNTTISNWVLATVVYRTDSIFLYVNGALVGSRIISCPLNDKLLSSATASPPGVHLGQLLWSSNFAGNLDDVGIWNRALTRQEIAGLYETTVVLAPVIEWQKTYGGSGYDEADCIQQTNDGGYIFAGQSFSNDGDVTGHYGDLNEPDYWIVKINNAGNIQWQKSFGGSDYDFAKSIRQTSDGGYIVVGLTQSLDGDVIEKHLAGDYWALKLDSAGTIEWQKCLGGGGAEIATSVEQTFDKGYVVAGYSTSNDGDVTGNYGNWDYWVVKLDEAGNIQWQKSLGGSSYEQARSIKQTTDSGFVVVGYTTSFDGNVGGWHGQRDNWVVKLSSEGAIQWEKAFGGAGDEEAFAFETTADGGCVVAGYSSYQDGDVSVNIGGRDYWIVELNPAGNIQWEKSYGGSSDDVACSISKTFDGGYVVGGYSSSNDIDVTGNHGQPDYWVIKLDSYGALIWQKSLGGTSVDGVAVTEAGAFSVIQTSDGGYIVASLVASNDGDVTGNHGGYDIWVVKLVGNCTLPQIPTSISSNGTPAKVSPGSTRTYFTDADTAVTFFWTVPSGATITSGQGTPQIQVTFDNNFACSDVISVAKVNNCGSSEPFNLTVYRKAPNIPSAITGTKAGLCGRQNVVYSVQDVPGLTYNWTVPSVANIVNGQGTHSITVNFQPVNFNKSISVKANFCGNSLPRIIMVSSNPSSPTAIYGNTTVCSNSTGNAFWIAPVASATTYKWRAPLGSHITANGITSATNILTTTSNTVTVSFGKVSILSTISVEAINSCGSSITKFLLLKPCSQRMENLNVKTDIKIYPNPNGGLFTLALNTSANNRYTIMVHDILGKELMKEILSVQEGLTEHQMDLQRFNTGLYFLTVISAEEKQVIKITKE